MIASEPLTSCLYESLVVHARHAAPRHRLAYRIASLYLDLDEIDELARRLRTFSHNRVNLFSFHDRDHGAADGSALRCWAEAQLARAGVGLDGGPIRILCMPRTLGYAFNPLTVWYCHGPDDEIRGILYEVRNTFGGRHVYVLPTSGSVTWRHGAAKVFHVSPFFDMEGGYRFILRPPGERLSVTIKYGVPGAPRLTATQQGRRQALTDAALIKCLLGAGPTTWKVMAGIHWEALKLWWKGARYHAPPSPVVTVAAPAISSKRG